MPLDGIELQLSELLERERNITDWLAKPNCNEKMRFALEESLRRLREERRAIMLKQLQTEKGPV